MKRWMLFLALIACRETDPNGFGVDAGMDMMMPQADTGTKRTGCLDRPNLDRPPSDHLPCELIPPGLTL